MAYPQGRDAPVQIFINYAHQDQKFVQQLERHLSPLEREGLITTSSDRKIRAGEEWSLAVSNALRNSEIILVLVSADYMASSYLWEKELLDVLERAKSADCEFGKQTNSVVKDNS
jgi:hypothetical protein